MSTLASLFCPELALKQTDWDTAKSSAPLAKDAAGGLAGSVSRVGASGILGGLVFSLGYRRLTEHRGSHAAS